MNEFNQAYTMDDISYLTKNDELPKLFREFMSVHHIYNSAIKEVSTKLDILNDEFRVRYDHNPIHDMKSRLKRPNNILRKLKNNNFEISLKSAQDNLTDIAGIRVVCYYIDDIYKIEEFILSQSDITLVKKKDYIKNPKANGYRSLHLVVKIPIFLSDRMELVPVEIQIRTIAMDFWASLEHQLRYKNDEQIPEGINSELLECAESISAIDKKMQNIYKRL